MKENSKAQKMSRRHFLAGGAMLGGGLAAGAAVAAATPGTARGNSAILNSKRPDAPYGLDQAENTLYTTCLQCNTGCGIKCKIQDGVVTKIDGNPYNPWTLVPYLPYETTFDDALPVDGALCPKGQSGLQTAYDPYRLRKVLKRAGKRGENKWMAIPFEQAVTEICDGGMLFKDVPGEDSRNVEGLRSLLALSDPTVAKDMAADIKAIWGEKDKGKKASLVEAFKTRHAAHLDKLIDPDHPDLGPKNNQIVLNWGRIKGGRGDFYKRFAQALGTTNAHGHTTVCQGSLYFTCKAISDQYVDGKFSGGKKFYWQADSENSRFILFVGANLFEANYGPTNRTVRLTDNLVSGHTRIAVADPRFSKLASKAWKWLPLKPGTDIPLAMAIMHWIFENSAFNAAFLANANKAAAQAGGEKSWTNSTWLVEVKEGKPGKLVRASDLKINDLPLRASEKRQTKDGKEYEEKFMVVMANGAPKAVDPNDDKDAVTGDLFVNTVLPDGTSVKSGLQILRESVMQHSMQEWCSQADVALDDIIAVARELTYWAPKSVVDIHRGPAQHTNGFYAVLAWMSVNMLLGNFDHKGGAIAPATWDAMGKGGLFDMKAIPGAIKPFGISSIRHDIDYEKTTLFAGYPAKRNWYPMASDLYQEVIPSIADAYPYPVKIMFQYMAAPTYALPAGQTNIAALMDVERLPLFISNDIIIGTTSMYADYIFPDLSFLERWEFQGSHPNMPAKVQPVRQPVIAPLTEDGSVFGQRIPLSLEAMIFGIAEYLKLPGFGAEGLGSGRDLKHPDDFYLRMVANLAFGEKTDGSQALPDADAREMEVFLKARRHLPEEVFDAGRWKSIVGAEMWPKVVYALNRGGRYQNHPDCYKGEMVTNVFGGLLNLYQEKTAAVIHSGTGERYKGYAHNVLIADYRGNSPDVMRNGYPLSLITHRTISQCKSRTITNPWLTPLMPENGILINPEDAAAQGLRDGDTIKVVSATNPDGVWDLGNGQKKPMTGKAVFTNTMRPGTVSFSLGFGHWATGANDVVIDGQLVKGEARRAKGINANAAMWTDPTLTNTCMFDPIGGSVSFYDTAVRLVPA